MTFCDMCEWFIPTHQTEAEHASICDSNGEDKTMSTLQGFTRAYVETTLSNLTVEQMYDRVDEDYFADDITAEQWEDVRKAIDDIAGKVRQ